MGSIVHPMKFDKPMTRDEAYTYAELMKFFGYHPAGYGGSALLVTQITKTRCNECKGTKMNGNYACYSCDDYGFKTFYQSRHAESGEKSRFWIWEHADSCD